MDYRQQQKMQRQGSSSSGHQHQYQYNQQQSSSGHQQFSQTKGEPIHHRMYQINQQQSQQNQHPHHAHYTQQQMQHANQAAQFQAQHSQSYPSSPLQQHSSSHMQQSHNSSSYQHPVINGPRAKCNQVIYEAITKSCEIAVRGRCTNLVDDTMFSNMMNNMNAGAGNSRGYSDGMINTNSNKGRDTITTGSYGRRNTITTPNHTDKRRSWNYGGNQQQQQSSTTSTSSRFNIEVNEVPTIRSTVSSTWKKSIHLPLRLDIYYEYDSCYDQQQQQEGAPPPPPQRELLERWCIDYIPSTSSSQSQSLYNSLSSSPSTSPYSSPYSSRILTGAITNSPRTDNNKSSSSSSMSQLRQVCKRIVILLRSLHCMTRMLPAYQLKCALISNMLGAVDGVVTQQQQGGYPQQSNHQQSVGWGHIGYSIHVGDEQTQYDPPLPSPSFQRQTLPSVSTPYGNMVLSVMYDATLQPNHMLYDIIERRNGWLLSQQQHQQIPQQVGMLPSPGQSGTQPIPINTHVVGQHASNSPGPLTINSLPRNASRRREYGSCPPAALMMSGHPTSFGSGGPASFGSNTQQQQRSRAASINIISDYHHSPRLKPTSSSPSQKNPSSANNSSPATGQNKRVMSGLSLAMMNEDDNTSPVEDQVPPSSSPHDHQLHPQAQREVDALILPFGSPMTRAAFHNPPPILSNDEDEVPTPQQQAYSSGVEDRGTHFFKQHGGYGYGYNGSNLQFTDEQQQTKEDQVPPPQFTPSLGLSISPNPRVLSNNTPPPPSPGTTSLRQSRSGTPPTSILSSRPLISSPRQYHQQGLIDSRSGSDVQRSSRHRATSSSAVDLLPPVSTLDMLGKSPFAKSRKERSSGKEGDTNTSSSDSGGGEKLLSSVPRVVNDKSDSTGVSTLGGGEDTGSSTNPTGSATGLQTNSSGNRNRTNTDSGEQLPFAVDDDDDAKPTSEGKSSDSPLKASGIRANRELWGSTKADMLGDDGPGGITLGVAETMAVSSLAHRCATDSKVRLRMFESSPAVGGNEQLSNTATSVSRPSIKDQLSDFRSFGASLMMDSTNESDKEE